MKFKLLNGKLAVFFFSIATWLEKKSLDTEEQSNFVDLAPTDDADKSGIYSKAIEFAVQNPSVFNIALTGPYGSGKSSIIQTFLKKYNPPALHISLATFIPGTEPPNSNTDLANAAGNKSLNTIHRQEIERSILQQMLYGADANKLPHSRFKRIQTPPKRTYIKSLLVLIGSLALAYVFHKRDDVFSGAFFKPFDFSNWINLSAFTIALFFLYFAINHFYVASLGLSLKSISLKDVEIKPAQDDQTSILNRHLDEIVYFFQATKYKLVIIEDLDRFNNPDIFITLREINSLVNENAGVKRQVRFLYALRDDMFTNTDRTKFFEFIIPVIPIINSSNSIDMVLKQGERHQLDDSLDRQFLREVSRYLNDLRLIQNIFNEFAVYVANLEVENKGALDKNKLLAVLICKNVYPRDFELLHRGEGTFATLLNLKDTLVEQGEKVIKQKIEALEKHIEAAERQTPKDLKELRHVYAMALLEKLPTEALYISLQHHQARIAISQLVRSTEFDRIINAKQIHWFATNTGYNSIINIADLQDEVDPNKSYDQRKAGIEFKSTEGKERLYREIDDLKQKASSLRQSKLYELMRLNSETILQHFESLGENAELARYLILEGYVDDSYYQYTSLFHSGRLSPNDNKFLIQIRAFVTPEPDFQIDNPHEVIASMRDVDFSQSYTLNFKLIDCLLAETERYAAQTQKFIAFISTDFVQCESFLEEYYAHGSQVAHLLELLARTWDDMVPTLLASQHSTLHMSQLVLNVTENQLEELAEQHETLSEFVEEHLADILIHVPELAPERIYCLDVEVRELVVLTKYPVIAKFMVNKTRFALTLENIEFIFREILLLPDLEPLYKQNYTAILSANNSPLQKRIERDFNHYLTEILLALPDNTVEAPSAILAIVKTPKVDHSALCSFLSLQTEYVSDINDVPSELHKMMFETRVIEPSWPNCLSFIQSEGYEESNLIHYLDDEPVLQAILQHPIPSGDDSKPLRTAIFNAKALSDKHYQQYVHALPTPFTRFPSFEEPAKLSILIAENKVTFSSESFEALADFRALQIQFIAANVYSFLENADNFSIEDGYLDELLTKVNDIKMKFELVKMMDLSTIADEPERASLIAQVLAISDDTLSTLDSANVKTLIENASSTDVQITLFNKYHNFLDEDEVRQLLTELPRPYNEIKKGFLSPKLINSRENQELVTWLESRKIISSWKIDMLNQIKVNLFRR
ncbi:ATP-binding protein [Pseudoalteromonas xiamenensis]|uniref:YobI family P-loop NTPase n=1 Tax=Pseudoalteromonas xiamenensis TaxID=882626 RepID=UPI0035EE461E